MGVVFKGKADSAAEGVGTASRRAAHAHRTPMHTDLDTDMDTDTETTALCPSGSHQASPPGTPTPGED